MRGLINMSFYQFDLTGNHHLSVEDSSSGKDPAALRQSISIQNYSEGQYTNDQQVIVEDVTINDANFQVDDEGYDVESNEAHASQCDADKNYNKRTSKDSNRDSGRSSKRKRPVYVNTDRPTRSGLKRADIAEETEAGKQYNEKAKYYREVQQKLKNMEAELESLREEVNRAKQDFEDTTDLLVDDLAKEVSTDWSKMYQRLVQYHAKRGHARVPRFGSKEELKEEPDLDKLGRWVYEQRMVYKRGLTQPERYSPLEYYKQRALEKLGFVWDAQHDKFMQKFEKLKAFKEKFGDCDVPEAGPNLTEPLCRDGKEVDLELSKWARTLRLDFIRFKRGKPRGSLNEKRIELLRSLGWECEVHSKKKSVPADLPSHDTERNCWM